jgi:hypothetical protein
MGGPAEAMVAAAAGIPTPQLVWAQKQPAPTADPFRGNKMATTVRHRSDSKGAYVIQKVPK